MVAALGADEVEGWAAKVVDSSSQSSVVALLLLTTGVLAGLVALVETASLVVTAAGGVLTP